MGREEKLALQKLIFNQLMKCVKIPRGYGKSITRLLLNIHTESIKRTNYILSAIGESL